MRTSLLLGTFLVLSIWSGDVSASDAIHFKDGMRTVCNGRVWEENNTVFCEYDGVVLSYPRDEVERIETGPPPRPQVMEPSPAPPAATAEPTPGVVLPQAARPAAAGTPFYDPRRPQKYWSRPDRRHNSYPEALAALAEEFNRPAQWIEANMGDSNDLATILETLSSRRQAAPEASTSASGAGAGIQFYNPRRPDKYWTGPDAHYATYSAAVDALGHEFGRSAEWVERYMGESNDMATIRETLSTRRQAVPEPGTKPSVGGAGIQFYNPRRPEKYWTGPNARYATYSAAVEALGREFGRSAEWVERHMGESNEMDEIRASLRQAAGAGAE